MEYSPHDQLPAPNPQHEGYQIGDFYEFTASHLIKDTVRIMDNGLHIDMARVIELESVLEDQLKEVKKTIAANPLIQKYLQEYHQKQIQKYIDDRKSKLRPASYYNMEFKHTDMTHRSYCMDVYAEQQGWSSPPDKLPTGVGKWPVNLVKKYAATNGLVRMLLDGKLPPNTPCVVEGLKRLAQDKADLYNQKFLEQVKNPSVPFPEFNPASPKQKQELFAMLGIESEETSKQTGEASWNRDQIERINKETADPQIKELTQAFIDHSFAAIVRNNFIEAFYNYTVNDRLYGQYNLLGAKTGRYTSSNPNMLNMPSTGSVFAKPIKKCFTAPKGKIILAADYEALEDRVIASLSRDKNKCNIFLENLDGHSLNALGYFRDQFEKILTLTGDTTTDVINIKKLVDEGNREAKALRQTSKPPTFALAYGAFPPKIAKSLKITLQEATAIFNNYHNVLYPGITDYRENYVLKRAYEAGEIHLGLGFYLKTDNPDADIRTLANATCQFWSILTALTINKMHLLIDANGLENDVKVVSTIYDSIYLEVTENPEIIKWVNDNLIETMIVDFMEDQTIKNQSQSDIGYNWADMISISNNASIDEIKSVLQKLKTMKE